MNEMILTTAALLLLLFCLWFSAGIRRGQYFPLPGGAACFCSPRAAYLGMEGVLTLSAAVSLAGTVCSILLPNGGASFVLHSVFCFFHAFFFFAVALYLLNLTGAVFHRHGLLCFLFFLPLLLNELLVLTNPLFRLLFFANETGAIRYGAGRWIFPAINAVYLAVGCIALLRKKNALSKNKRILALVFLALCAAGTAVRDLFSVPVELLSEAVAVFGMMVLLEEDGANLKRNDEFRPAFLVALTAVFLTAILGNVTLIQMNNRSQADKIGNIRLEVIRNDLEDTISEAEKDVLLVAMGAEQLLDSGADRSAMDAYFSAQYDRFLPNKNFMNVYIGGADWHIVPNFEAPPDFHASERIWYLGAKENPGQIFVTEPYLDASTGAMCFTVSTLLSDGTTVVGMDLNLSKAQESIAKMTDGTDQTAMIVTSGGLIAGYSDMALVGERAVEKLPEYEDVLRRVMASNEHNSFRAALGGRQCMIFSSETNNNWHLILSVGVSTLYAESYGQIASLVAIDLLMLLIVVIYYIAGSRDRGRLAKVLTANQQLSQGFAVKLQGLASRVRKFGDAHYIGEGGSPEEIAGQIRESGESLSELAADLSTYSAVLSREAEEETEAGRNRRFSDAGAPTRHVRNGVIAAMLLTLVVILFFFVHITTSWGSTRMNREADKYESQLEEWITQQKSILSMFTDMIAAKPELLNDYQSAVHWLQDVSRHYPDISLCYLANPYAQHPVIMSNGWEPGEDYRPETRPWYRATERSITGFSISAPYMDAQTGNYCVTFSRIVNGEKGEFLGIFGIDFFLDKLISVLGESYTSSSYAFLVDSDGIIVNHPNTAYQMGEASQVNVEDTEYANSYNQKTISALRDYDGHYMVCLSRKTELGFSVLVADRWWNIYGNVVLIAFAFMFILGVCLAYIVSLINRLIRWQEEVNHQLKESAEAAESANRAKSQFLSQMSHEIRTPMNAIIGLQHIALRDETISQRTRTDLEKIGASARHLLSLINDILDMSRIESGRMTLKEEPFSFREFVDQINVIINGQCEEKGLRYEYHQIGPVDESFTGDSLKLKQVLINILGNSVKFTETPGIVSFSVEQTESNDDICALRFTMKDTGIGMDKEFIPKLFQAFSQEDATTTNRYGGSGLGMAISKSIIEMIGGEISVESEKGVGSTFTVRVSLKRAAMEVRTVSAQEDESEEEFSIAGRHLLIAEDQPLNAEILIDLLEMEEVTTEWAENGQLAVERFAEHESGHFDGILMDMRMPVMDGLTATREIRKLDRPDAKTIPIIALTANAFDEDVKQCLQAGMNAHLSKPIHIELLKKTLGRLISPQSPKS